MDAIGTGSGKLILFGEHAVVFGYPGIGIPLPESTTAVIHGPRAAAWDLEEIPFEDRRVVQGLLDTLEGLLPELVSGGRRAIRIQSSVPRGVGLGSSAALCAAMAAAALAVGGENGSGADVARTWQLAHELERGFHGTPSGIDTGLSLLKGLTAFSPKPPALPAWEPLPCAPLWLVVGALPRSGDSASLIQGIGRRARRGEQDVRESLSALGRIAGEARERLAGSSPAARTSTAARIGQLADKAMDVLRGLGLSHPSLDDLLGEGIASGALGGKLSGAGGGGAFFLVCGDAPTARQIAVRLQREAGRRGISLASVPRALCVTG